MSEKAYSAGVFCGECHQIRMSKLGIWFEARNETYVQLKRILGIQ